MSFAAWEGATECTGGPTPGGRALMAGCLAVFGVDGARSLGIYNCRTLRARTRMSCHAEGRACDVGFPLVERRANPAGQRLVDALLDDAEGLGIQAMIFDRVIWSRRTPHGRPFTGASPHLDHVHIELSRLGGRELTLATVQAVLGTGPAGAARREPGSEQPEQPEQPASVDLTDPPLGTGPAGRPTLRLGSEGRAVEELQVALGLTADGIFGRRTEAAVRDHQAQQGLTVDGAVGPMTWDSVLRVAPRR